jgi:hypothetical protein
VQSTFDGRTLTLRGEVALSDLLGTEPVALLLSV